MTRDDIIRMAREAGGYPAAATDRALLLFSESHLERFATLVAEEVRGQTIESEKRGWLHAIDKAIQDAMLCGTGVMKFSFIDGLVMCDHVPIKDFAQLSEELKWRFENTHEAAK